MPPFEGMSPAQEAPKKTRERIEPGKVYSNAETAAQAKKLNELAEAGRLADELYANRLAELIKSGDMAGIAELSKSSPDNEMYTQGNATQERRSGEMDMPKDDLEKLNERTRELRISNLISSSLNESPNNESPDDSDIDDIFNGIKAA